MVRWTANVPRCKAADYVLNSCWNHFRGATKMKHKKVHDENRKIKPPENQNTFLMKTNWGIRIPFNVFFYITCSVTLRCRAEACVQAHAEGASVCVSVGYVHLQYLLSYKNSQIS